MKKKIIALLLAIITAFSLCVFSGGCKNGTDELEPTVDDETTLTILAKKSDVTDSVYIQRIFDRYEAQTGKKIKPLLVENADFDKTAAKMFKEGKIPDMLLHFNDSELAHFDVEKNFYYLNDQPWVDELLDTTKANCVDADGNILGLPFWESSVSGCYYNKTILDKFDIGACTTQAEFDRLCQAFKDLGYTPMYWAANGCNWMFQFGLDPIFADNPELLTQLNANEIKYADIQAVRDMITWLANANEKGWFNTDYADKKWDDLPAAIGNGKVVTFFSWDTWFSMDLSDDKNYQYTEKDFALMPVFMNTADGGTYEGGNMNLIMVNKNGAKLQLALDFLNFCMNPDNYNVAFDGIPTVKCFKHQTTNVQSEMVEEAMPSISENQRVSTAWAKIIGYRQDDVGAAVLKLFQGETDVDGCIKLMDDYRIAAARELGAAGF